LLRNLDGLIILLLYATPPALLPRYEKMREKWVGSRSMKTVVTSFTTLTTPVGSDAGRHLPEEATSLDGWTEGGEFLPPHVDDDDGITLPVVGD
jgi:hypothetical protein